MSETSLEGKSQPRFTTGRWNPHHNCVQIATANDTCIRGWDLRTLQLATTFTSVFVNCCLIYLTWCLFCIRYVWNPHDIGLVCLVSVMYFLFLMLVGLLFEMMDF